MSVKRRRKLERRPEYPTEPCYICERPVGSAWEHDHFPVPMRDGGTVTLLVCEPCHSLKDRYNIDSWNPSVAFAAFEGLWAKALTSERLLLAKMFDIISTIAAERANRAK